MDKETKKQDWAEGSCIGRPESSLRQHHGSSGTRWALGVIHLGFQLLDPSVTESALPWERVNPGERWVSMAETIPGGADG